MDDFSAILQNAFLIFYKKEIEEKFEQLTEKFDQ